MALYTIGDLHLSESSGKPMDVFGGVWQDYRRKIVEAFSQTLQEDDTVCEMALDEGELRHNGKAAPLCEIELEYVAGSEDTFHALAAELAQQLDLVVEPTSKLARAMAL